MTSVSMEHPIDIFLSHIRFKCPEIEAEDLEIFRSGITIRHFKSKEYIFDQKKPLDQMVYVLKGLVRSIYTNEKGSEISAYFIKEFDFVSDYPAFLKGVKSNYVFETMEETTVAIIPKALIMNAYESSPKFEKLGRLIAEEAVHFLQGRMESLLFKSATERYLEFVEKEPDFFNRLSLEQIASYIGVERQSLTRIRKKLTLQKDFVLGTKVS